MHAVARLVPFLATGMICLCSGAVAAQAQAPASLDTFRIFLRDGRVMSTQGEFARVEDDLVFVVTQGQPGEPGHVVTQDLITVPVDKVDLGRTVEYANALRVARYGATRGEREYIALTADISHALAELEGSADRDRRLGIALVARRRLAAWSREHYDYRADDLRHLVDLFDGVIVELQAATGLTRFSLDLVANPPPSPAVPLLAGPTPVESVEMALVAASVTAVGVEKMALLTSARRVMATLRDAPEALKSEVARVFEDETRVEQAYRAALRNAVSRADVAVRQGQPRVVARLIAEVTDADARLGHRRPREVANVLKRLATEAALAGVQQAALKRWAEVKDQLQAYDVRVKRILAGWTSHEATLAAIQKESTASPGGLEAALRRFSELERALTALRPPDEMQDVHGVLRSAVLMARQGLIIGQRLAVAANTSLSRNASAAVRGASLLRARAFADLAKGMAPQRVR